MLFNSIDFIFLFLPIVFALYFFLQKKKGTKPLAKPFLVLASLFFYSFWNPIYLPLILVSMIVNFTLGHQLKKAERPKKRLITGLAFNLMLLGYFKYADFFIQNINIVTDSNLALLKITLPLAISFFTFQQIAFLVDCYRGEVEEFSFQNYALFVTFFPQLIAGPIVHHKEMMPQFADEKNDKIKDENISNGLFIFFIGLFKKVVIADYFAKIANLGFDQTENLAFIEAWVTSLSYTMQLYFDFSGYTDMAIGVALLFNIRLPQNFNSPYKAQNIQDFWRRWHMTLSRFLKDYLYIPLGGNRGSATRTSINLFLTFLLGGLWHGASWMFVIWGAMHGVALVIHRFWQKLGVQMPKFLAWFVTFHFVNICWVFFRATKLEDAFKVLEGMFGLNGIDFSPSTVKFLSVFGASAQEIVERTALNETRIVFMLILATVLAATFKNSNEVNLEGKTWRAVGAAALALAALVIMDTQEVSEFLYFNF